MKKILVNLKDWLNYDENVAFASQIDGMNITVFPSLPYLNIYKDKNVRIGSQKISSFDAGPHTGSISANHLKDFNVQAVILNHRECQIDDIDKICAKVRNAQEYDMDIIICMGSSKQEELSKIESVLNKTSSKGISIAYEPYENLEMEDIKDNLNQIKSKLSEYQVSYIYGGNITVDNFTSYNRALEVEGFLISSNALNVENLKRIIDLSKI